MPARPRTLPEPPPTFPPFPDWARLPAAREGIADAAFCAGAALAAIHPVAQGGHPLGSLWRQRLALSCAEATVRRQGRREDAAALRDHLHFAGAEGDPGPAGRMLVAWRELARPSSLGPASLLADWPLKLAGLLDGPIDRAAEQAIAAAPGFAAGRSSATDAAAGALAASLKLRPDNRPLALWLADAVLARRLRWPAPVPLLAAHLQAEDWRLALRPDAGDEAWRTACRIGYARAAAAAFDLYADLARRAGRLLAVAPKLRGKDADATVLALLSEDAHAARAGRLTSERSSRRLFDRLVELGVVRELTGRPTFRLYGL